MNIVKEIAAKVFNCNQEDVVVIERLMGGKSNQTYLFEVYGKKYTFRIPGKSAEKYVNRDIEEKNLAIAKELGMTPGYIYLNKETSHMICEYIEGADLNVAHADVNEVAQLLKKYHRSEIKAENDYNPLERLGLYESYNAEFNHEFPFEYTELKEEFISNYEFLNKNPKVFCHNDSQRANFIKASDRLYLLDWEFAGNNDLLYDIACFGNNNFDDAIALLNVYLEKPTNEDFRRLHLWRAFQCLQWYNVAMYKEYIGLSEELSIDFKKFAVFYINLCKTMIEKANQYI